MASFVRDQLQLRVTFFMHVSVVWRHVICNGSVSFTVRFSDISGDQAVIVAENVSDTNISIENF